MDCVPHPFSFYCFVFPFSHFLSSLNVVTFPTRHHVPCNSCGLHSFLHLYLCASPPVCVWQEGKWSVPNVTLCSWTAATMMTEKMMMGWNWHRHGVIYNHYAHAGEGGVSVFFIEKLNWDQLKSDQNITNTRCQSEWSCWQCYAGYLQTLSKSHSFWKYLLTKGWK